jgi:hypothetical protein
MYPHTIDATTLSILHLNSRSTFTPDSSLRIPLMSDFAGANDRPERQLSFGGDSFHSAEGGSPERKIENQTKGGDADGDRAHDPANNPSGVSGLRGIQISVDHDDIGVKVGAGVGGVNAGVKSPNGEIDIDKINLDLGQGDVDMQDVDPNIVNDPLTTSYDAPIRSYLGSRQQGDSGGQINTSNCSQKLTLKSSEQQKIVISSENYPGLQHSLNSLLFMQRRFLNSYGNVVDQASSSATLGEGVRRFADGVRRSCRNEVAQLGRQV